MSTASHGASMRTFAVAALAITQRSQDLSGNSPGIQRDARAAGKESRSEARLLAEATTPDFERAATTRRAWRSPVPTIAAATPLVLIELAGKSPSN